MSELDILFPLPDGRRNADDMGVPPAPPADPIDDLCARLRKCYAHWGTFPECVEAAVALQRLRAENAKQDRALTQCRDLLRLECESVQPLRERAERAEAERDTLAAIVRAADAMRRAVYKSPEETGDPLAHAYDTARAKWEGK